MKNKVKIIAPIIFIVVVIFIFIFRIQYLPTPFDNLFKFDFSDITKVLMRNGSNGSCVETTDKGKIQELISFINDRNYAKSKDQRSRAGYTYYYDFYIGDKIITRITGTGANVNIGRTYFDVSKEISYDLIRNWFESLPVTGQ